MYSGVKLGASITDWGESKAQAGLNEIGGALKSKGSAIMRSAQRQANRQIDHLRDSITGGGPNVGSSSAGLTQPTTGGIAHAGDPDIARMDPQGHGLLRISDWPGLSLVQGDLVNPTYRRAAEGRSDAVAWLHRRAAGGDTLAQTMLDEVSDYLTMDSSRLGATIYHCTHPSM